MMPCDQFYRGPILALVLLLLVAASVSGKQQGGSQDIHQVIQNVQTARAKFMNQLTNDYGAENVQAIFFENQTSMGRTLFAHDSNTNKNQFSWQRMVRKVTLKVLEAQQQDSPNTTRFIWGTGGHSACAGHGNLFNESYTQIMANGIGPIFKEAEIQFEARPYGMGATSSGMEIASCVKEIFGSDIDVLSWDFGMTTVYHDDRVELYLYRAAMLPNRPAFVMIESAWFDSVSQQFEQVYNQTICVMDSKKIKSILANQVPDTLNKTQDEIDAMPPFVRGLRCGEKNIEKGDLCGELKYTMDPDAEADSCNKRKGRVSWHPGWKWHALYGNFLTLFLAEILEDALRAIRDASDPQVLQQQLKTEEENDALVLTSTGPFPPKYVEPSLSTYDDIPTETIYKKKSLCHTARLPAQQRYLGIVTEAPDKTSRYDEDSFDLGTPLKVSMSAFDAANPTMKLSFDESARWPVCTKYKIHIDYMDFFIANSNGVSKLLLPNPTEVSAYNLRPKEDPFEGFIAMCLAGCGWSCPQGVLSMADIGNLTLTVNNVAVQNYSKFDEDCVFLKHANGHKWNANADGLFELAAIVSDSDYYVRFSSFIIW